MCCVHKVNQSSVWYLDKELTLFSLCKEARARPKRAVIVLLPTPPLPESTSTLFWTCSKRSFTRRTAGSGPRVTPDAHICWLGQPAHADTFPAVSLPVPGQSVNKLYLHHVLGNITLFFYTTKDINLTFYTYTHKNWNNLRSGAFEGTLALSAISLNYFTCLFVIIASAENRQKMTVYKLMLRAQLDKSFSRLFED